MSVYSQTTASAPGWWQPRCTSCGWRGEVYGDERQSDDACDEHVCQVPVGTGYRDAFGNVWLFQGGGERRMLEPGEVYIDTHGARLVVGG